MTLFGPSAVLADEAEDEQDVARELHDTGAITSLSDVLAKIAQQDRGVVAGVNLVRVGDPWFYRLQVVAPDGRRSIVDVDAGSTSPLLQRGDD